MIIATTNVVFGTRCPRSSVLSSGLFSDTTKELFLPEMPTAFCLDEVHHTPDLQVLGTFQEHYVLGSKSLDILRSLPASNILDLLHYTDEHSVAAAHMSLVDSYTFFA
jgi:hypothetical protein